MLTAFKKHINQYELLPQNSKILATVSGGVDSVVLCHLLKECEIDFSIAHCNFKLRGDDSENDERFVKSLAEKLGVDFYAKSLDTKEYSAEKGISTQMAARELRYNWFDELKSKYNFDLIVTAHQKNDNVETVLLNLVRGTSHKGLAGIKAKNKSIIRPLLPFTKDEILDYAKANGIEWREDVSNQENKYKRNLMRNEIIPLMEQLNPNLINTFSENIEKFELEWRVLSKKYSDYLDVLFFDEIKNDDAPLLKIWNWLEPFEFTFSDAKDILNSLDGQTGIQFLSKTHRIVKDRDYLILFELNNKVVEELTINDFGDFQLLDFNFQISKTAEVDFSQGESVAFLNAEKMKFPLKIRKWKNGDKFKPLGMKGQKLISDFLIDEKVSVIEKEKQLVLESDGEIAWLVGRRISESFKVIDHQNAIKIELKK